MRSLGDRVKTMKESNATFVDVETINKELSDRQHRSCNIIIYNLPESNSKTLAMRVDIDNNLFFAGWIFL